MLLQDRQRGEGTALPCHGDRRAGGQAVLAHDRRIFAAGRRVETIAEAGVHRLRRIVVEIDVDRAALLDVERAQIVDAVGVVGVLVGVEHGIEPIDLGIQKLLAQVGRGVDQDPGDAAVVAPFDQQ